MGSLSRKMLAVFFWLVGVSALSVDVERRQQCVPAGNQCGGSSFAGSKTCCDGLVCTVKNQWYSQCLAGSSASQATPSAGSAGCGKNPALKTGYTTINSGGTTRNYHIHIPDNYDKNQPYRLIFGLHWLSGSYRDVVSGNLIEPFYGLEKRAAGSAIFLSPDGLDQGWANTNDRDLNLIDELLKLVQNDLCIDTQRIFSTGFSYGGGMSYSLACSRANVFRAVAVLSGAQLSGCSGGDTPIAYLGIHGIGDSVLSISLGRQLRDKFVQLNGCQASNPQEPSQGSGSHVCTKYTGCNAAYPVEWCAHAGGHTPSDMDEGASTSWIPDVVWEFFSQF